MGSLAMVHTFCGLYHPDTSKPPIVANAGLPAEIEAAMRERTGQAAPEKMGRVYVLPQHPDTFNRLAQEMVAAESDRLSLSLNSECTGITCGSDGKFTITLQSAIHSEPVQWSSHSVVDCSANAAVAHFLKVTRMQAELTKLQRPAYIFSLRNVEKKFASDDTFRMRLALDIVHAVRDGQLPPTAMGATMRPSPRDGEVFVSLDLDTSESSWNPAQPACRAEISSKGRSLAAKLRQFYQATYPSFHHVSQPYFPEEIGVRESFRWLGQYTLTGDDLISGQTFDDAVAYATWPIELRESTHGAKFQYFKSLAPSQIPLRSLASQEVPGVYCAGRCLSASHRALASVRVMGTSFATGQSAGIAASLYASGTTEIHAQAAEIQSLIL